MVHLVAGAIRCHRRETLRIAIQTASAAGQGDDLVVWKLDRLGRSLAHLVTLLEELGRRRIGFTSLTESIDTTTSGGRLIFHVMAALTEFERALMVERTRAGMKAAKRRERYVGQSQKLPAAHLDHARALLASGAHTRRSVAALLGVDESTLRRRMSG